VKFPAARRLYDLAACIGVDPSMFDEQTYSPTAIIALRYCAGCPVRSECIEVVKPGESYYDGVAGGFVWARGRALKVRETIPLSPKRRDVCGTPWGYEKHRRSGEGSCEPCLTAVRKQKAENRRARIELVQVEIDFTTRQEGLDD
jgi:hypothetical protein